LVSVAIPVDVDLELSGRAIVGTNEQADDVPALDGRKLVSIVVHVESEGERESEIPTLDVVVVLVVLIAGVMRKPATGFPWPSRTPDALERPSLDHV
jgi:hypothetical protein